ncbi:MAG TPA: ABC transporter ATP-binding protein [Acidimicrobiales bacterium]
MIHLDQVSRVYGSAAAAAGTAGAPPVRALDRVTLRFDPGTFTAVMGPSGSGKSTLLHCAAGMDRPTEGSVWWGDTEVSGLPERRLAVLRRERVGFVFQSLNLIPAMTAAQNVELPSRLAGRRLDPDEVVRALAHVGLGDRAGARPAELSGGQQQRVAIARALVARPDLVFADEPTGALDRRTGRQILDFLRAGVDTLGQTCVMVTHDPVAASVADRVVVLEDGRVVDDLARPSTAALAAQLGAA